MPRSFARPWEWAALVLAASVLPWRGALGASYLADDFFFAAMYRQLALPLADLLANVFVVNQAPTTFYRPLAFATLAAEVRWWGNSPVWLHVTNIVIHAATTLGVFAVARRLVTGPSRDRAAALGACAFALFPRRVEAVAWLSCRPDLLCGLSGVAMLWLVTRTPAGRRRGLAAAHAAWWFALLSKEAAIALPLALPFITPPGTARASLRARIAGLWPWLVSGAAFLVVRRAVIGAWFGGYGPEVLAITPSAVASPAKFAAYLVIPPAEWLSGQMLRPGLRLAAASVLLAGLAVVAALLVSRRHHPAVRGGVAWAVAGALPVVLLNVSLTTTFNDRLFYLPGLGVGLLLAGLAAAVPSRVVPALWLIVAGYGVQQVAIVERWGIAGAVTERVVAGLAGEAAQRPAATLLVAAVPDSYRGAYVLRNGLEQALALRGVPDAGRVVPLGLYYLDDPRRVPVEAWRVTPREVCVQSLGPRDEVVVRFPPAGGPVAVATTITRDRYGRRPYVVFRTATPSDVVSVSLLGEVAPVPGADGRALRCPAWDAAPVRQPDPR